MQTPDETSFLTLSGGERICVDRYGPPISPSANVVLLVNGGPGLPCDYLRDPHASCSGQLSPSSRDIHSVQRHAGHLQPKRHSVIKGIEHQAFGAVRG